MAGHQICLGSFLGLRCLTRARAYTGRTRATWLLMRYPAETTQPDVFA